MWIDATVAAGFVSDPKHEPGRRQGRFRAGADREGAERRALVLGLGARRPEDLQEGGGREVSSSTWATSADYIKLVGETNGWTGVPPGTRKSTYANADYIKAAPFAEMVEQAIQTADLAHPTAQPGAVHRHPVRRDPRVPGDRHAGRPAHRRRADRADAASTTR